MMDHKRWKNAIENCIERMNQAALREDATGALQCLSYIHRYDKGERSALLLEQLESV